MGRLGRISGPTLVLTGADDALCQTETHSGEAKNMSNNPLEIIKNCGHLSTLETARAVTEALFMHWGLTTSNPYHFPTGRLGFKKEANTTGDQNGN